MKKLILSLAVLSSSTIAFGQNWKAVNESEAYSFAKNEYKNKRNQKIFKLDRKTLDDKLVNISSRNTGQEGTVVIMPNSKGNLERFEVWEASNFSEKDQAKFPNIRSYVGKSLEDPTAYLRFSTGPSGISSSIFRANDQSEFLETYSSDGQYFEIHQKSEKEDFNCSTPEQHAESKSGEGINTKQSDQKFKTYRLALSVTGEYSQKFGGTVEKSLEAMNASMTRVNGVFEKDMALNFVFADNIEKIIYLDSTTDPYSPPEIGMDDDPTYGVYPYFASAWNVELQKNLRDNFGEANYDIGHLFGHAGGGGNAGCIGCICESSFPLGKGSGFTAPGSGDPSGDSFDIDYVTHEIGHQIGANHTYSFRYEGSGVLVEPGSGSTIMGYAGITLYNVQSKSDDYFTYRSIDQVQKNLANKTCGVVKPILNTPPKIELAKTMYQIPISTAFKLDAKVTDAENDALLMTWEQNNSGTSTTVNANSRVKGTKTAGPNFRSFKPVKETYRYFPKFSTILADKILHNGAGNTVWESVTSVARVYEFSLTARDYNTTGAQTQSEKLKVIVTANAGPFIVKTPDTEDNKLLINTSSFDVTWDVAKTDVSPINTTKVKVSISWDNGETFDELGIVDNTGTATFAMPANAKSVDNGYIMIEAVDNIFLAVKKFSTGNLSITELNNKKVALYPNPSNGSFTVEQKATGNVKIEIVDLNGRKVYSTTTQSTGNFKKQIDTKLPSGVYFVIVSSNEGENTSKLIVK